MEFLGVYFDSRLTLQKRVEYFTYVSCCLMTVVCAVCDVSGNKSVVNLWHGYYQGQFVLSRLDYCNAILAGLSTLAPLQRVQNAAGRPVRSQAAISSHVGIIIGSIRCHSGRELNISYAWSPTWQWQESRRLISRRSCMTTAKSSGSTSRSTVAKGDIFLPRIRLRQGERALYVAAPRQWNRLPTEIRYI